MECPAFTLHKLSKETDLKLAALVEPLSVACHDVRLSELSKGETAVVLGGASLMGGKGSIFRTFLGVLLLGVINNGLNIMNVQVDQQLMVKGVIIVAALALSEWAQRSKLT